jgi:hypothetical protein
MYSPTSFEVHLDPSMLSNYFSEKKSMTTTDHTPESLAAAVRELAGKDNNADLSKVTKAVDRANEERKERIVTALRGAADLAVLGGAKGKRFVIVYWHNNEAKTAQGTEYPIEKRDEDGDPVNINVLVNDEQHPFYGRYRSMPKLREALDGLNLAYHIAYFDK